MKMIKDNIKNKFLDQIKIEVPFYGWTKEMLFEVEKKLSLEKNYHVLLFPGELKEIVTLFEEDLDNCMTQVFEKKNAGKEMKVSEKIKECIKIRFKGNSKNNKIILSKLNSFYFTVNNFTLAYKNFWRTVDKIWYLAGDKSTDFNYYTKRGLLFTVYKSTFLYYINSDSNEATWDFLDKKIQDVMKLGNVKNIPKMLDKIPFFRLRNKR